MRPVKYNPTREEIARVCAKIREGWTPLEWERRAVRKQRGVEIKRLKHPRLPK